MDSPTSSATGNVASDSFLYCQHRNVSAHGTTGHAYLRKVEVVQPAANLAIGGQSAITGSEKYLFPKKKWFHHYIVENQSKNDQPPKYNPKKNVFSIHSLLGLGQSTLQSSSVVDCNLHQPVEISNQASNNLDRIDTFSKPTEQVAILKPQLFTNLSRTTTLEDAFLMSDKESRVKYEASDKRKEAKAKARAKYFASDKGKKARAKYFASDKGKKAKAKARAKYFASDKGKKARAKYFASDKGKVARAKYEASDKCKEVKAKYEASDKAKEASAIRNARSNAYRSALKQGLSEELASAKGESVACTASSCT